MNSAALLLTFVLAAPPMESRLFIATGGACPLWLEGGRKGVDPALLEAPEDVKRLAATATTMHAEGNLVGADILLRRAIALGADDKDSLDLYRTVEFLLEDAPFKLP